MGRICRFISMVVLVCMLFTACSKAPAWQEQYDLGVKYLSEGNYAEAVIAFTAAIEIDPKRPEAFIGRGGAYIGTGETAENLALALGEYESALELDETLADAWLGLADVYIRQGEYDKALEVLREALEKTGAAQNIADKVAEMEAGSYIDSAGNIRRTNRYDMEGQLHSYTVYSYDSLGRRCGWENYNREQDDEGNPIGELKMENYCEVDFDEKNRPARNRFYEPDGTPSNYDTFVYNDDDLKTEQHRYEPDGTEMCYFLFYYDEAGREIKYEGYSENGLYGYWISEYDEQGNLIGEAQYDPNGEQIFYSTFE